MISVVARNSDLAGRARTFDHVLRPDGETLALLHASVCGTMEGAQAVGPARSGRAWAAERRIITASWLEEGDLVAVRKILRMGHPVLRQVARPIEPEERGSQRLRAVLEDMTDTLRDYGGIGLAAPQVGESIRLALIEIPGGPTRYGEIPSMPLTVLVNPVIEVLNPETAGYWEGCLSIPGLRGYVERPQHIRVTYMDLAGENHVLEPEGFVATVFQHELDHLDGTLYIDRIKDSRLLGFDLEYERYLAPRSET